MAETKKCTNCGSDIPVSAQACAFCEAAVKEEPSEEEKAVVMDLLSTMDPADRSMLMEAIGAAESEDEFIRSIFVGSCPKCDSDNTGDCENDPEIDNLLVGRCMDCHCYWCTECGRILDAKKPECPCWDEEMPEFAEELDS
jgi:hypothetical protein